MSQRAGLFRRLAVLFIGLGLCLSHATPGNAWGPVPHAVIGQMAEDLLLQDTPAWRRLLARWRESSQSALIQEALLGLEFPADGDVLRLLANWPDWHKRAPGMLEADEQRHYVNLPFTGRYTRRQHCPDGRCSLETLLEQRAIFADQRAPLARRAVALAWVTHLLGDIHQPLHAGRAEDRGGNLTCVSWLGEPSRLVTIDQHTSCSRANLHVVWDSKLIEAVTGFARQEDARAFARLLRPLLPKVRAAEAPLIAPTAAAWRRTIEQWHHDTQAMIVRDAIYPPDNAIDQAYLQRHYPTARSQILRAAVRLAALLRQSLQP
ncbi:MAG: S1/P1 nuclease [Candidatus Tectimicrobiota bacterium]